MKDNIGIITEQGFVAGSGLGYTPITEDLKKKQEEDEEKK